MIHPTEMARVSILGPKSAMDEVVEQLHDLQVLHIDDYDGRFDQADIGDPAEGAEELSDRLVKIRSVKSRLPDADTGSADAAADTIDELGERVDAIEEELDRIAAEKAEKEDLLEKLEYLAAVGLDPDDIQDYRAVDIHLGTVDSTAFTDELEDGRYELYRDGDRIALFVDADLDVADLLRDAGFDRIDHGPLRELDGPVDQHLDRVRSDIRGLEEDEAALREELAGIGAAWRDELEQEEAELAEELEKAEAPLSFATTDHAFIAEGWIPAERYDEVEAALEDAAGGSIHIEKLEETGAAPVEHDNPGPVKPMESLLGLYGTPSYGEIDPSFLLLTFPILFGFMLGDVGYGLTTFAVFYGLYRKFPEAKG
ncbi:MAG: V-type ATPase 116kDa subunit family protein, partial [Candidatus Nanohaloarchaea archaeon]|nr:V-type ATPase 116kDa subunit family protein [Candidatus Nanohaloarchaea archaeon]